MLRVREEGHEGDHGAVLAEMGSAHLRGHHTCLHQFAGRWVHRRGHRLHLHEALA